MATFSSSTANGYKISLAVNASSQDIPNNRSLVDYAFTLTKGSTYYNAKHTGQAVVNGSAVWSASGTTYNASPSGSTNTLASGSMWVSHNSDGTKTISVSANLKTDTQGYSWSLPYVSLSGNYALPTIARMPTAPGVPTVTVNPATGTMKAKTTAATAAAGNPITGYIFRVYEKRYGSAEWNFTTQWPADSNLEMEFDPNQPLNTVRFEAAANTAYGNGPWSTATDKVAIGSGPKVLVSGTWKTSNAFMKVDGAWVPVWCFANNAGTWKRINK